MKIFLKKNSVFLRFSASTLIRTVSLALTGLIILTWITPNEIGIYNSYNIFITYAFFLQVGIFNGLNRQIPYLLGQGNEEKVNSIVAAAQSLAIRLSIAMLFVGLIIFLIWYNYFTLGVKEAKMLLVITFLTSISYYQNYLNVTYRTTKHFAVLSKINNVTSVFIFLGLFLVYFFSYNGLVLYYLFNGLLFLVLTHINRPFRLQSKFSWSHLKELALIGMPIFILGYLQQIARTFNRLILLSTASVYVIGIFSPAAAIYTAVSFLPTTIAQFLYPKFSYLYGKHNDKKILKPYVNKIYMLSGLLIIPTVLGAYFVLPWAFRHFVPQYTEGILAAQLFLIAGVVDMTSITINIFYSIGNRKSVIVFTLTKMMLLFCLPYALTFIMPPLDGVSVGTLISVVISACFGYILLIKALNDSNS